MNTITFARWLLTKLLNVIKFIPEIFIAFFELFYYYIAGWLFIGISIILFLLKFTLLGWLLFFVGYLLMLLGILYEQYKNEIGGDED